VKHDGGFGKLPVLRRGNEENRLQGRCFMSDEELIQCPDTRRPMRKATNEELGMLQRLQASGQLFNRLGRPVAMPIEEGYVSEAARSFYCVAQGVIWLVAEESIPIEVK
jgi:hypothetical protein